MKEDTKTEESKAINAAIYNPHEPSLFKSKSTDHAEATVILCKKSDQCGYFAEGKCILVSSLFDGCVYGGRRRFSGPTKRAKGCGNWISEQKEKYKDVLWKLKTSPKKMTIIGDFVYLPYSFMAMNKSVPFFIHDAFLTSGRPFVPKEQFTVASIESILKFQPRAMDGGIIRSYAREELPKFALHLKEVFPDLYAEAAEKIPLLVEILASSTMIGRKASVHSLKPGTVVTKYHDSNKLSTQHWTWDGEWLESMDAGPNFGITAYDESIVRIKPRKGEHIIVTNDAQVDENTIYVD